MDGEDRGFGGRGRWARRSGVTNDLMVMAILMVLLRRRDSLNPSLGRRLVSVAGGPRRKREATCQKIAAWSLEDRKDCKSATWKSHLATAALAFGLTLRVSWPSSAPSRLCFLAADS